MTRFVSVSGPGEGARLCPRGIGLLVVTVACERPVVALEPEAMGPGATKEAFGCCKADCWAVNWEMQKVLVVRLR